MTYHVRSFKRANAAFVALVRNSEREAMRDSMRNVEARFNKKFGYPWVFLNEEPFDEAFKVGVRKMTRSQVTFGECAFPLRVLRPTH